VTEKKSILKNNSDTQQLSNSATQKEKTQ